MCFDSSQNALGHVLQVAGGWVRKGSGYSMSLLLVSCLSLVEVVPVGHPHVVSMMLPGAVC